MEWKKQMLVFTICVVLLMGLSGMVSATSAIDGTVGYSAGREDKYTPSVSQSQTVGEIRLGVWWPRYDDDLPPYSDLAAAGIEASDVVNLTADTLPDYDVIYILNFGELKWTYLLSSRSIGLFVGTMIQ